MATRGDGSTYCDVCWGSHACRLPFGHDGHHVCCCTNPEKHWRVERHIIDEDDDDPDFIGSRCAGTWPYYGPELETRFYGDDVPAGWLRVQ